MLTVLPLSSVVTIHEQVELRVESFHYIWSSRVNGYTRIVCMVNKKVNKNVNKKVKKCLKNIPCKYKHA
jgi:hypothetical protein